MTSSGSRSSQAHPCFGTLPTPLAQTDSGVRGGHSAPSVPGHADAAVGQRPILEVMAGQHLRCVFQPIFSTASRQIIAVEALSRITCEPVQSPDRWFAEAHRVGLGLPFEMFALESALAASSSLPPGVRLALNLSPEVLGAPEVQAMLIEHTHRNLAVEITEHTAVEDYASLHVALARLRSHGVQIAVDDAGAGFASFRHILAIKPDFIKVDRSVTQAIDDPSGRALATAFATFAQNTETLLVAEGVETCAQLDAWADLGAYAAQGYLLARPGELDEIAFARPATVC